MNRRERRHGRMYLLPLLLGLTGMALLALEWGLRLEGLDEFGALAATMRQTCVVLIYPAILFVLYVCRIPPKAARIVSLVSLALLIVQLAVVLHCSRHTPAGFSLIVPGHDLMNHIQALKWGKSASNILFTCADASFVLSTLSAVLSCLVYAFVKTRSDRRNEEFDRRNAYLIRPASPDPVPVPQGAPEAAPADEPTKVLELPADEPTKVLELPPEDLDPER